MSVWGKAVRLPAMAPKIRTMTVTMNGGYNGGATIRVYFDGTQVFTSTAPDVYNGNYNVRQATVHDAMIGDVDFTITVTGGSSKYVPTLTVASARETKQFTYYWNGYPSQNSSYGYGSRSETTTIS